MRSRILLGAAASVIALAACGSDDSVTVKSTTYTSTMNGANEVGAPVRVTSATGSATYVLSGRTITYTVTANGLTGPATASHIHIGIPTVSGGIIFPFTANAVASGTIATGTINLDLPVVNGTSTMSGDSLLVLFNSGSAYTNIHTAQYGAGEIRGQIIKQ